MVGYPYPCVVCGALAPKPGTPAEGRDYCWRCPLLEEG